MFYNQLITQRLSKDLDFSAFVYYTCLALPYLCVFFQVKLVFSAQAIIDKKTTQHSHHKTHVYDARLQGLSDLSFISQINSLNNIVELNLSNNSLQDFNIKTISQMLPKLSCLNVSYNKIEKLRSHMIGNLPRNFMLDLSNNPIQTTSKNIVWHILKLADKNIILRLYDTQLPPYVLKKLEHSITQKSWQHKIIQLITITIGILLFAGSIPLKALSDDTCEEPSTSDSLSSNSSSSSDSLTMITNSSSGLQNNQHANRPFLKALSICMFASGIALMAMQPFLNLVQHNLQQSRLFWKMTV